MQVSIARQLGLQPSTVGNFFMNARRRLHDKWQNSDYNNESIDSDNSVVGAKICETNNNSNLNNTIMLVDGYSGEIQSQQQPHDLSFALEAIESIEQPPSCSEAATEGAVASVATSGVYSLTSL